MLPEDTRPLKDAVSRLAGGGVDFVLFTSRRQVEHVMQTARGLGPADAALDRAQRQVVASIGPVCSDALRGYGLPVDLEPQQPKMGYLVVAGRDADASCSKRSAPAPNPPSGSNAEG